MCQSQTVTYNIGCQFYTNYLHSNVLLGITKLVKDSDQYKAATNLIAVGVDFDTCDAVQAGTILRLKDVPKKNPNYHLPNGKWVDSARLDNQGDINKDKHR